MTGDLFEEDNLMNTRRIILIALTLVVGLLAFIPATFAQGVIIDPRVNPSWAPQPGVQPISLDRETYEVTIDDQFAHIKVSQVFRNNTYTDLEGTYIFPLPPNADISDFALWLDGRELTAETMEANQARQIYQSIVNSMRDPGLLEYMGDGLIRARIYPIPRGGTKQVDVQYDWLLPIDTGLMRLTLPLKLDGYSIDNIKQLAITVEIDSPDPLGTIYSPTHDVDVSRHGPNRATVGIEKSSHRPTGDFVLYISRPEGAVGLNMLTHATGGKEGYFLAMIAPEYDESRETIVPKDFVLVIDTSGSMAGDKIEQAKSALEYIFQNLNPDDRFNLITFATDVYPYFQGWRDASRDNVSDVTDYIRGIDAGGSTNIKQAFETALDVTPDRNRPMYIVFISDGLPTVGETNTAKIIEDINGINSEISAKIFSFGVGDDVDYQFIDRLSRENGGYTANVAPNEDLEQPLSDFYAKIKSPVMTNIEVEISGARIYDMLPETMPDLFLGSQLILTGRYNGGGRGNVAVAGMIGGERVTYNYAVEFTDSHENDFIPRQWATRRVGYLLNQIRLYGENQEVVDEITQLARRYGIITPYTSMLVTEDETHPPFPAPMPMQGGTGGFIREGFRPPGGPEARDQSTQLYSMESGNAAVTELESRVQETVRYAGDKTFYLNADNYWEDSVFADSGLEPVEIPYLSQEYYDLLTNEPDIADYLAVAEQVIVVWNDKAYKIVPNSEEPATSTESSDPPSTSESNSTGKSGGAGGCGMVDFSSGGNISGGYGQLLPITLLVLTLMTAAAMRRGRSVALSAAQR